MVRVAMLRVACCLIGIGFTLSAYPQESAEGESKGPESGGGDLSVAVGFDYTAGKYGTRAAHKFLSIPVHIDYDTDEWGFGLAPSYAEQRAPAGAIRGRPVGTLIVPVTATVRTTRGLGDTIGTVTRYVTEQENYGFSLDVVGEVKFATADVKKGLGTGENDYTLQSDLSKSFGDFLGSASLGYTDVGKPTGFRLRNFWYGILGGSSKTGERTSLGISYNFGQPLIIGGAPQQSLTLRVDLKTVGGSHFDAYVLKGLTNGSPDQGIGASFTYYF